MIQATSTTSSDTAISVRGVGKSYTIKKGLENQTTLAEQALQRLKNPLKRAETDTFWALQDIDMEIKQGEVVGIIGRNGAGKSTLLKVLSRITYPTTGEIDLYGRVGSLLEVGTGFHPELTGRENIFLNGAVLGMNKSEIKREFDAIVEFAGVQKFLETPVKRYSSGMYVRLAFAVAAHLRTEILIVDEVLAVGDADFQKRCMGKMHDVANGEGRTVLFVSHQMHSVSSLCDRCIVLKKGEIEYSGNTPTAIEYYMADGAVNEDYVSPERDAAYDKPFIEYTKMHKVAVGIGESIRFDIGIGSRAGFNHEAGIYIACLITDAQARSVTNCDSRLIVPEFKMPAGGGSRTASFNIDHLWLKPGKYTVDLALCGIGTMYDRIGSATTFSVDGTLPYPRAGHDLLDSGVILSDFNLVLK